MDVSRCRELIVLAEHGSFSAAAEGLFVTQSALSKHVAAAEREVGFRIFDRTESGVRLTDEGAVFIEGMREVVERYDAAVRSARAVHLGPRPAVRVMGPLLNDRFMQIVSNARAACAAVDPEMRVVMNQTGVRDCREALLSGECDVAIAFRYGRTEHRLRLEHLMNVPFGIACSPSHPLASKMPLRFEDLAGQCILSYPLEGRAEYHEFVERVSRRHGIPLPVEYVPEGCLCAPNSSDQIVFGIHYPGYARLGLVSRPLDDTRDMFDVCVARRRREPNPMVVELFDSIARMRGV